MHQVSAGWPYGRLAGAETSAARLGTGQRKSGEIGYISAGLEPMTGIEPAYSAWEVDSAYPCEIANVHGGLKPRVLKGS
jgi:hypothetical protein